MAERRSEGAPAGGGPMEPAFPGVVERATRVLTELDPVRASWLGFRGRHDHLLADCSPEGTEHARDSLSDLLSVFESLDSQRLDPGQRIDRELACGTLSTFVSVAEQRPVWRTMPQAAMVEVLSGISVHLARGCGPPEERGAALLGRLRGVPAFLAQAQRSLREPPPVFTELAILAAERTRRSLALALNDFVIVLPESTLVRSLERAGRNAMKALEDYEGFLRSDLMSRSTGDFRLGATLFNRVLREEHRVPVTGDELVMLGERIYHGTLREIRDLAGRIRPGQNWSRMLAELLGEHPPAEGLVEAYRGAVDVARRFLIERDLVTLPEGEELLFLPTPLFARRRFPHAGYLPCGASDQVVRGILLVTSPEAGGSAGR
jgi:hypothetical protein